MNVKVLAWRKSATMVGYTIMGLMARKKIPSDMVFNTVKFETIFKERIEAEELKRWSRG